MDDETLFTVYRKQGDIFYHKGELDRAVLSYDTALQYNPQDKIVLIARSRAYLQKGEIIKSLQDADASLKIDKKFHEALLQKAEILYRGGHFEKALVFFERGREKRPDITAFSHGITKCRQAILNTIKCLKRQDGVSRYPVKVYSESYSNRVSSPLNLSRSPELMFARARKIQSPNGRTRVVVTKPVISFNPQNNAPPPLSLKDRRLDQSALRRLLGDIYPDKIFLERIMNQMNSSSRMQKEVKDKADAALTYLYNRVLFWGSLEPGALPNATLQRVLRMEKEELTAPPKRKRQTASRLHRPSFHMRQMAGQGLGERGEGEGSETVDAGTSTLFMTETRETEDGDTSGLEADLYEDLNPVLLEGRSLGPYETETERRVCLLNYAMKEVNDVDVAFSERRYEDCVILAERCLHTLARYNKKDMKNKALVEAALHSYMGNAAIELGDLNAALFHHQADLDIGLQHDIDESKSRAYGNLGRVYARQQNFLRALNMLSMKAPHVTTPRGRAWLHFEVGNCFLALRQYTVARDLGRRAQQEAASVDDDILQMKANTLTAMAEVRMTRHSDAYNFFERALENAIAQGDSESERALRQALEEVNGLIVADLERRRQARQTHQLAATSSASPSKVDSQSRPPSVVESEPVGPRPSSRPPSRRSPASDPTGGLAGLDDLGVDQREGSAGQRGGSAGQRGGATTPRSRGVAIRTPDPRLEPIKERTERSLIVEPDSVEQTETEEEVVLSTIEELTEGLTDDDVAKRLEARRKRLPSRKRSRERRDTSSDEATAPEGRMEAGDSNGNERTTTGQALDNVQSRGPPPGQNEADSGRPVTRGRSREAAKVEKVGHDLEHEIPKLKATPRGQSQRGQSQGVSRGRDAHVQSLMGMLEQDRTGVSRSNTRTHMTPAQGLRPVPTKSRGGNSQPAAPEPSGEPRVSLSRRSEVKFTSVYSNPLPRSSQRGTATAKSQPLTPRKAPQTSRDSRNANVMWGVPDNTQPRSQPAAEHNATRGSNSLEQRSRGRASRGVALQWIQDGSNGQVPGATTPRRNDGRLTSRDRLEPAKIYDSRGDNRKSWEIY